MRPLFFKEMSFFSFRMSGFILKPNMIRLSSSGSSRTILSLKHVSTSSAPWMGAAQAAGSSGEEQARFRASLEKYSTYQPTPVSIQHFINFAKSACPESSFSFLKHELPVRLANIMKELQLLPHQLHETHACKVSCLLTYLSAVC